MRHDSATPETRSSVTPIHAVSIATRALDATLKKARRAREANPAGKQEELTVPPRAALAMNLFTVLTWLGQSTAQQKVHGLF